MQFEHKIVSSSGYTLSDIWLRLRKVSQDGVKMKSATSIVMTLEGSILKYKGKIEGSSSLVFWEFSIISTSEIQVTSPSLCPSHLLEYYLVGKGYEMINWKENC